jgi:putative hydrolase of the HAD superfamily
MIKAILFDADGMVIITQMFSVQFCQEFKINYGKILPFFEDEFQPCLVGKADLKKKIKPWLKKWNWQKSVDEFLEYWFKAEHHFDERVVELIKKLREAGIKCHLTTNQEKYRTEYMRQQMGFGEIFDTVFSSAEIGFKKPQKEYFAHVLKKIGLRKSEIQFWDDKEKNVEAAAAFGFDARIYKNFEEFEKEALGLIKEIG